MKTRLLISAGVAALLLAGHATAQTQDPAPAAGNPPPPPPSDTVEVIVTAQKRAQSVQKTPFSIAALKGDDLAATGKTTVADALRDVPGVQVQGIAQGSQIFIRGVGSGIDPSFADPSIALMTDGVYTGRTESVEGGGFDVDRVEVLRGPQGTLYGRNASGGAVNVVTNQAKLGKYEAMIRGQIGNYNERRVEGMINVPVGDKLAFRISGYSDKHDSYVDQGGMDLDARGVRLKVYAEPTSWLRLSGKMEYSISEGYGPITVPVAGSAGNLTFPPPIFFTNFDPTIVGGPPFTGGVPIQRFPNGWEVADPNDPWSNDTHHYGGAIRRQGQTYMLQADVDLGWANLTLLPSVSKSKNYLLSALFFGDLTGPYTVGEGAATYKSMEARLASKPDAPFVWMIGAYALDSNGGLSFADQTIDTFNLRQNAQPGSTRAVFGQVTYPVTDHFRLTGGYRVSQDTQGASYQITSLSGPAYDSGLVTYDNEANSSSFKVGFEYDLAPRSLMYGHVASGFKQGGLSPSLTSVPFKPETLLAYELGVKNRLFDNHLLLNAAAFYYDYKNYQVSFLQSQALPGTTSTLTAPAVINAGPTNFYGAELQTIWLATPNDEVRFNLNYLHAVYGDVTLPNNPFVNQGDYALGGHPMANSPEWTTQVGYTHTFDLDFGRLSAGFDTKFSTGYYATAEEYEPGAYQKSYHKTDALLRFFPKDKPWSMSAFVRNIENDAQTVSVFPLYRRYVTAPRTYGLTIDVRY